jgi:hypothetical protein
LYSTASRVATCDPTLLIGVADMAIGISSDHLALADTVARFLVQRDARGAARAALDGNGETLPHFWSDFAGVGWLGLHLPEDVGGSGFGLAEAVMVVEQLARVVAPGPFVPTIIASAVINATASREVRDDLLPGLADGSTAAAVAVDSEVRITAGRASGSVAALLGGGASSLFVVPVEDDVVVLRRDDDGVTVRLPDNLDPTLGCAVLELNGVVVTTLERARPTLTDVARLVLAAEAAGIARACTDAAASYARSRTQFGRPIGTFQAVKHHCANMFVMSEVAAASVWDAAASAAEGAEAFSFAAAMAASVALPAADDAAQLNIQVHGGIGFTWEHDAHLYLRRATAARRFLDLDEAAAQVVALAECGVALARDIALPAEAEPSRAEVRSFVEQVQPLDVGARLRALLEAGYATPHWPPPWGRAATAIEQLVIEEEFAIAGIDLPAYGITGWILLTLIQHGNADQVSRWVPQAMALEEVWCQLFSEPEAGSDAAGVKARAVKVEGGWVVNGQKVWTSGAHLARYGLATVRTDPDAPKHQGITVMVIDMQATGVQVRPLRMITGQSDFNEVFLDDVFVADADVVGEINAGWTVARATLGNESVSIGGSQRGRGVPAAVMIEQFRANDGRLAGGGVARIGRHIAKVQSVESMNLRRVHRAVSGSAPGPEGAVTKLVLSENVEAAAAISGELAGASGVYLEGPGGLSAALALSHRGLAIAGGTSEIKRNQIAERILGLPRDPLTA